MHSFHKTFVRLHKALMALNGSNQMKYTEYIMNGDHAHNTIFVIRCRIRYALRHNSDVNNHH